MIESELHHRIEERKELKRQLLAGTNLLMLAPRRIGKTWLMERSEEDLVAEGHPCIRINLEGMSTEKEFLLALCQKIEEKQNIVQNVTSAFQTRWRQFVSGTSGDSLVQMLSKIDPRLFLETLVSALDCQEQRTMIFIDEFSLFVLELSRRDLDGTRTLLYHLRKLQQEYTNVSWLLTGSVGLDAVARRLDLEGALLEFEIFPLEPFTEAQARSFLAERSAQGRVRKPFDFDEAGFAYLVRELSWLAPYYLDHIVKQIRPTLSATGAAIATESDVATAFDVLLSSTYRAYFSPWKEHITKNFPKDEMDRLLAILAKCCENADGEIEATLLPLSPNMTRRELKDLLTCLGNDGYLMKDGERWRFRSGLLRRYWLEYMA